MRCIAFWFLLFYSDRQVKRVRTSNNITEDVWNAHRAVIRAEHRLPTARTELEQYWKEPLIKNNSAASSAAGPVAAVVVEDGAMQFDETDE